MNEEMNETTPEILEATQTLLTEGEIPGSSVLEAEIVDTPVHTSFGEIPSLDNLSEQQKSQLKELQHRMELYNQSRSGHKSGDTHTVAGVGYVVSQSGAYTRMGAPKKSRKATHRKEVASRRSGKS